MSLPSEFPNSRERATPAQSTPIARDAGSQSWLAIELKVVLRSVPTKVNAAIAATAINAAISAYSIAVTPDWSLSVPVKSVRNWVLLAVIAHPAPGLLTNHKERPAVLVLHRHRCARPLHPAHSSGRAIPRFYVTEKAATRAASVLRRPEEPWGEPRRRRLFRKSVARSARAFRSALPRTHQSEGSANRRRFGAAWAGPARISLSWRSSRTTGLRGAPTGRGWPELAAAQADFGS
jgi:hypothetical protein